MSFRPPVRDDLVELPGYHSPQLSVTHRLNTNESPEPPPPGFVEQVAAQVAALDWNRYPDRSASTLREKLAAHHRSGHVDIVADNVFVANGSNEVLQTLLLAWGGPGRRIVTFEPTYAMHGQIARVTGTEVIELDRNENFEIDPEQAIDALRDTKPIITFLCSPNNPTGIVESPAFVSQVLETVSDFGLLVVDEAYAQFADWTALDLFDEDRPLIVTRTFSKTWAMAAARLGYLLAPQWVTERLNTAVLPYHLDAVSQIAGSTALDFEPEMDARVARMVEQRGVIQAGLAELNVPYWPSQSNFVLFRPTTRSGDSGDQVWEQLVERGVLVRNCASWPRLDGCLRVTIGNAVENRAFLDALAAILG